MTPRTKTILVIVATLVLIVAVIALVWYPNRPIPIVQEFVEPAAKPSTRTAPPQQEATPKIRRTAPAQFFPKSNTREIQVLDQAFFTIGYDNQRKNPAWVVYYLDGPIAHAGKSPKRPRFYHDLRTTAKIADSAYTNSGYDRGHMAPAYAQWSRHGALAFEKTFVLSNVVPQTHGMNAGIWEDLEDNIAGQCRGNHVEDEGYAGRFRNITVINGPIYDGDPVTLRNGTWVPTSCFSIVLDFLEDTGKYRAMAFEIPNMEDVKGPLLKWATTIKKIESATGLDFFAGNEEVRANVEEVKTERIW